MDHLVAGLDDADPSRLDAVLLTVHDMAQHAFDHVEDLDRAVPVGAGRAHAGREGDLCDLDLPAPQIARVEEHPDRRAARPECARRAAIRSRPTTTADGVVAFRERWTRNGAAGAQGLGVLRYLDLPLLPGAPTAPFHAVYAGAEALVSIEDLSVLEGNLKARALGLVIEWARLHQDELRAAWDRARAHEPPGQIEPLE